MPHTARIKTPLKQHLHRFRLGALPVLAFLFCVIVTLWLWERQATPGAVVGEIEALQVDVAAAVDGLLVAPGGTYWQRYDPVQKGQVVAHLDDKQVLARLATTEAEIQRLTAELESARADFENTQLNLVQADQQDLVRMKWEVERRRLELLRLVAEIRALQTERDGLDANLQILESLNQRSSGLVSQAQLAERRLERQLLETRLEASRPVYEEAKVQYDQLKARLAQYKPLDLPALEAVLAPVKAALVVQEALIQEIEVQRQGLVITAPIDGVITSIHRLPGQTVLAGDPVVTIAQPDSRYVISYVRERQRIGLYEGMEVGLRLRGAPGSPEYISSVEVVGPQVASVPPHQLSDQSIPEWATPIKIPLPPEMRQEGLRPGQLVQVIFRSARR